MGHPNTNGGSFRTSSGSISTAKAVASEEVLLTSEDVCRRLKISRTTLWSLRRQGRVAPVTIAGTRSVRFRAQDVDALVQTPPAAEAGRGLIALQAAR